MTSIVNDQPCILILDFGSQYTQLIARRVREIGVYSEILPFNVPEKYITDLNPVGVILSGGPESIHMQNAPQIPSSVWYLNVPVLGICYGMQAMAMHFNGDVISSEKKEFGHADIQYKPTAALFEKLDREGHSTVWMSHGDKVDQVPPDFEVIASSDSAPIAAMAHMIKPYYGLQFHPEVTHTQDGEQILEQFVCGICHCEKTWKADTIIEALVEDIKQQVGQDAVLLGLSGGVDSSVVAALVHKAIGDQLTCVFVDNGLLRLNEGDQVMEMFAENMGVKVVRANAQQLFLSKLSDESDPEAKRKIIGNTFVEVFEQESLKLSGVKWLAQGTIYPDVIESAANQFGTAHVIKSHHNVGGLPEKMQLKLLEPIRDLFKDEVRKIGVALGLPKAMLYRHPFPGPGLGVRILGEIKPAYCEILQQADAIYIEELHAFNWYDKVSQAFAVFLPVKSVGVVGDSRRYEYVIALRAVQTIDFMTAKAAQLPWELLEKVSRRIVNEIPQVARVVYDTSSKPPATIEWE